MNESRFVWLASYPRSGNTWLRLLLGSLSRGGRPVDINAPPVPAPIGNREELEEFFAIDSTLLTAEEIEEVRPELLRRLRAESHEALIFRKVHERWRRNSRDVPLFPAELSLGAIYLVRDPRDVAVSFTHMSGAGIDETIRAMADPAMTVSGSHRRRDAQLPQSLGTWSDHARSWLDESGMPVCLIRYEDLLADAAAELTRVVRFLNLPEEFIAEAVEAARFGALRSQEERNGFRELRNRETRFFREGKAGQWRTALSPAQAERIERDHGEIMARLGYL